VYRGIKNILLCGEQLYISCNERYEILTIYFMAIKIGIIGSGQVAQVLAKGFLKHGWEVMIGSRDLTKLQEWKVKSGVALVIGSLEEVASFGDILVLAVKGAGAEPVITRIKTRIDGKTIIDTTNPIEASAPQHGVLRYFTDINESLMERLQQLAPAANFVKAFNSVGNAVMVNPEFAGAKPTMFIAGNDDNAKKEVAGILDKFGWEIADMGKVQAARAIEPLCMLWCISLFLNNEKSHAFKLLKP
jgi:8-hydroxy-5-deazaflavin:NADPH oxidoreductase